MSSYSSKSCQKIFLAIVIVNYRSAPLTIDCLDSLTVEVANLPNTKVFVVENASGDDSLTQLTETVIARGWSNWVTVIASDYNGGYAFGNNLAIRKILAASDCPTYFLLLNPDTFVRPGAIRVLVDFMEEHPDVGIAGSRLEETDGTPQNSAFRFHSIFSELDSGLRLGLLTKILQRWTIAPPVSEVACPADWVAGASMIIRTKVFEQVGLLDEGYFLYFEEVDFCLQAKRKGWSCWYVPQSKVVHLVGQSSGVTNTKIPPKRRPSYWFESRRRYFIKNYGWFYALFADIFWVSGFVIWKLRQVIQRKPSSDPPYLLIDFLKNSIIFKGATLASCEQNK